MHKCILSNKNVLEQDKINVTRGFGSEAQFRTDVAWSSAGCDVCLPLPSKINCLSLIKMLLRELLPKQSDRGLCKSIRLRCFQAIKILLWISRRMISCHLKKRTWVNSLTQYCQSLPAPSFILRFQLSHIYCCLLSPHKQSHISLISHKSLWYMRYARDDRQELH